MSAYTLIETQLVSEEHLVRALEDLGFEQVERHAAAQPLVGFEGLRREQRAEIIIRKRYLDAASNDLGFARDASGRFTAIVSDFDRGRFGGPWLQRVTQRYAYHVTRDKLAEQGFALVEERVDERDTIRLTLRRTA